MRFLGTTDFAPGEWAGVELNEAIGKNDGSVGGKRYGQFQGFISSKGYIKHGKFSKFFFARQSFTSLFNTKIVTLGYDKAI